MAKIVHGVSVALGFAVACMHALCGAEKSEARPGAYSEDAFLPGVSRTAETCARSEDPRKNRAKDRMARAPKSEKAAAQYSAQTEFFCDGEQPPPHALRADFREAARGQTGNFAFSLKTFGRSNPIRAPSAA